MAAFQLDVLGLYLYVDRFEGEKDMEKRRVLPKYVNPNGDDARSNTDWSLFEVATIMRCGLPTKSGFGRGGVYASLHMRTVRCIKCIDRKSYVGKDLVHVYE